MDEESQKKVSVGLFGADLYAFFQDCAALGDDCSFATYETDFSGWAIGASFVFGSETFVGSADGIGIEDSRQFPVFVELQDAGTDNVIVRAAEHTTLSEYYPFLESNVVPYQIWDLDSFDRCVNPFGDWTSFGGGSFSEPQFIFSLQMAP